MRNRRSALSSKVAGVAVGTALGIFAIEIAAAQAESPIDLTWNAPPGCSDGTTILKQVAALRGARAAAADRLKATANVTLDPSGTWRLQIATVFADGTHGERQIQAESCKAAADATASILALALTARAAQPATTATPIAANDAGPAIATGSIPLADAGPADPVADGGSPPAVAAPVRTPVDDDAGASIDRNRYQPPAPSVDSPKIHGYAGVFVGGTTGDLPSLGLGGGALVGATYGTEMRVARLELYGDYLAFGRARFASSAGGANFQVFSAGARTCLSFGGTFSLGPCIAFELGSMRAQSFDVSRPSSGNALVANGFLGALARLPLDKNGAFALRALLEIGASFERPQFVLDGVGFVHQPAPVLGRGTLGAELRF